MPQSTRIVQCRVVSGCVSISFHGSGTSRPSRVLVGLKIVHYLYGCRMGVNICGVWSWIENGNMVELHLGGKYHEHNWESDMSDIGRFMSVELRNLWNAWPGLDFEGTLSGAE